MLASSILLYHSCFLHLALSLCSVFLAPAFFLFSRFKCQTRCTLLPLFPSVDSNASVPLFLFLSICLDPSLLLLSLSCSVFFLSFPLFLSSVFCLALSDLSGFKPFLSLTMPSLPVDCSANCCVSVSKPSLIHSFIVCGRPVYDRCVAGKTFVPMEVAELPLWESHHLASSSLCWNVELTELSRDREVLVSNQDPALACTPESTRHLLLRR